MRKTFSVSKDTGIFLFILAALLGAGYSQHSQAARVSATSSSGQVTSSPGTAPKSPASAPTAANPNWNVRDDATFLDPANAAGLAGYCRGINQESGVDIRFIFTRNAPENLESYAVEQAREIGIGRDTDRRSMLFVYDVARQRMRVAVGPGLEGMFPDGLIGYITREQTVALFATGKTKLALKTTLNIVSHRLREAALDGSYNPRALAYIANADRLADGGGATTRTPGGRNLTTAMTTQEVLARYAPQPTVAEAYARYIEALRYGHYEPDLPLYTPHSERLFRALPIERPFAEFIVYAEDGHKYNVVERGDVAILYFTDTPLVSPHLFRHTAAGWQLDIWAEYQNTREFVGYPYTWGMYPSDDDYWRAFSDLMADFGPLDSDGLHTRPQATRILRPANGDNRSLPRRRRMESGIARALSSRTGSLLLPIVGTDSESLGYPTQTIDRLAMRRLLRQRAFDSLDSILTAYGDSAVKDYRLEYRLFDAYGAFEAMIPGFEPLLNEWVERNPESAPALLARGSYYWRTGEYGRSYSTVRNSSPSRWRTMSGYYRKAAADFNAALRLAPRSLVAYRAMMFIANAEDDKEACRQLLDAGLKIQPYSFRLRSTYMETLLPRVGGSYEQMKRFADESAPYAAHNPRIRSLGGYVDWEKGRLLGDRKEWSAAIEAETRALSYGDLFIFRFDRGQFYWLAHRDAEAYEDLTKGLLQRPQSEEALYDRSSAAYNLGYASKGETRAKYFAQSYDDILQSIALDPIDMDHQQHLAFVRQNLEEFEPPPQPR